MKNTVKIATALALIAGVSATALTIDTASARGWGNGQQQGQQFKGQRGGKGGPQAMLKTFDADKDGALTKEEITTGLTKKVTDNDKDGDGALTLEEFKAEWEKMTQERMVRAYQRMDRDGNGKVTTEELTEQADRMFERGDRNNDGKIDSNDRPQKRMGKRGGQRGGKFQGQGQGQGRFQQGNFGPQQSGFGPGNGGQGPWFGQQAAAPQS